MKQPPRIVGLVFGAAFGFLLGVGRLSDYDTIHGALRLTDLYVFGVMGGAIAVALPLLWVLERRRFATRWGGELSLGRTAVRREHVVGGVLFGSGWAVAGTCPAPALVMTMSGATLGLVAVAGIFAGLALRDRHVRTSSPSGAPAPAAATPAVTA